MLKILTVCGVGMGTSLMLRMLTEDVLQEIGMKAHVEATNTDQAKGASVDLILTSTAMLPLVAGGRAEVREIKSFIDKAEIKAVLIDYFQSKGLME